MKWFALVLLVSSCRCQAPVMATSGDVRVEPAELDFGDVYVSQRGQRSIVLTNTGRSSREVTFLTTPPFSVQQLLTLGGGESTQVQISLEPLSIGAIDSSLNIHGATPSTVQLKARVLDTPQCQSPPVCQSTHFDFTARTCLNRNLPDGTACSSSCLTDGHCVNGTCLGTVSNACDDRDLCTLDGCGSDGLCLHVPRDCPVVDACTAAFCDPRLGCQARALDDGTPCGEETCREARVCISGRCVTRQRPGAAEACTPVDIVAGGQSACVLTRAGTVRCWGGLVFGPPRVLPFAGRATSVSMGTCATLDIGGFQCQWREGVSEVFDAGPLSKVVNNRSGSCWLRKDGGVDCRVQSWVPPPPSEPLASLAAGPYTFCGTKFDGGLTCWGAVDELIGSDGGLVRTASFALRSAAHDVRRSDRSTCVFFRDGIDCWSNDATSSNGEQPRPSVSLTPEVVDVAVAFNANKQISILHDGGIRWCAFSYDGGLECREHDAGLPAIRKAALDDTHMCFITTDDEVACTGDNTWAQLGDTSPAPPNPSRIPFGEFRSFSLGQPTSGALKDGGVLRWENGQPEKLPLEASDALDMLSWHGGVCILHSDGGVDCWNRTNGSAHVEGLPALGRLLIAGGLPAGRATSDGRCWWLDNTGTCLPPDAWNRPYDLSDIGCTIEGDGGLSCYGDNRRGHLGTGSRESPPSWPTHINLPRPTQRVGITDSTVCALLDTGQVWCWGTGNDGGIALPTMLSGTPAFARNLVCGTSHCCLLSGSNGVSCWGWNGLNQLGRVGPPSDIPLPVALPARVERLQAYEGTTCALLTTGELWCWGDNHKGERGFPPLLHSAAPVYVR